jgi:D-beta-D-heptose 7-phosphate kinase/D-beta-D-heptose 1-phosphate adenosyltransferase
MNEAAQLGDLLIVAMNDDAGILRLKGANRPLLPLNERLKVMAALRCTDLVTWFEEETPIPLLRLLRPELLVKGGDYPVEGVVGHDIVHEWNGEARVLSVSKGYGTSALAEKMKS